MSWGSECCSSPTTSPRHFGMHGVHGTPGSPRRSLNGSIVYEYAARSGGGGSSSSKSKPRSRTISSEGMSSLGSPLLSPASSAFARPPSPPHL